MLSHARALLNGAPPGACAYLDADLRDVGAVLIRAADTLDFAQPVAVMMLAVLQLLFGDNDPYRLVGQHMDAVPAGSFLAISHPSGDFSPRRAASLYPDIVGRNSEEGSWV